MAVEMAKQKKAAMKAAKETPPEELGLQPNTFVMPYGKNRPGWWQNFKGRLRLEKKRWRTRMTEVASAVMYKFSLKPRPKFHLSSIPTLAADLHKQMYTALASADFSVVESHLCPGILSSLQRRVAQRPPGVHLKWRLHHHITPPTLVSYKASVMPAEKGSKANNRNGQTQAVVRIHSLQSLQHLRTKVSRVRGRVTTEEIPVDARGRELPAPPANLEEEEQAALKNAKEAVEYLVVQKMLLKGVEGPWKVWGTTEEMTMERLEAEERKVKKAAGVQAG